MSDDRKAALDNALKKIEKNFGKGSIMRMGDKADTRISTVTAMGKWIPAFRSCRNTTSSGIMTIS